MTLEEEIRYLRQELMDLSEAVAKLRTENEQLCAANADLRAQLAAAQQRIAELEQQKTPPPAFVKPNTPARPQKGRKKRAPEHNHARRLERPRGSSRIALTAARSVPGG